MRLMILLCATMLLSGCVKQSEYCDIASPLYFDDERTVIWLSDNDPSLLRDIVINNEIWADICDG